MTPARASRTAEHMAVFRALESCRRAPLFRDPWAAMFLPAALRAIVGAAHLPPLRRLIEATIDRRWPGARTSGVARTALIDDELRAARADGIDQIVLLGAGYDCRAYRLPALTAARIFEVDHPATSAAKQAAVRARLGHAPAHVAFVALDFNRDALAPALDAAGFVHDRRSFFLWEGVTNYLRPDAVDATLHAIASLAAPGSRLLFTYVHAGVLDGSVPFDGTRQLRRTLRRVGEPWTFGVDPAALPAFLDRRGFRLRADWDAADYRARYLGPAAHRIRGYEFYHAALADVGPRPGLT